MWACFRRGQNERLKYRRRFRRPNVKMLSTPLNRCKLRLCPARCRVLHAVLGQRHPVAARACLHVARAAWRYSVLFVGYPTRQTRQGAADDPRNTLNQLALMFNKYNTLNVLFLDIRQIPT